MRRIIVTVEERKKKIESIKELLRKEPSIQIKDIISRYRNEYGKDPAWEMIKAAKQELGIAIRGKNNIASGFGTHSIREITRRKKAEIAKIINENPDYDNLTVNKIVKEKFKTAATSMLISQVRTEMHALNKISLEKRVQFEKALGYKVDYTVIHSEDLKKELEPNILLLNDLFGMMSLALEAHALSIVLINEFGRYRVEVRHKRIGIPEGS